MRENMCANPSVEVDATGWSAHPAASVSGVRSEGAAFSGEASFRIEATTDAPSMGARLDAFNPIAAGVQVTVSVRVLPEVGVPTPTTATLAFRDDTAAETYATLPATITPAEGGWLVVAATHTVPQGRECSAVLVALGNAEGGWRVGGDYAWTGTPGESTSTKSVDGDVVAHNYSPAGAFRYGLDGYATWSNAESVALDTEIYQTGTQSVHVVGSHGTNRPQSSATRLDAGDYEGSAVRAQAWIRTEPGASSTEAGIWIGGAGVVSATSTTALTDGAWELITVDADVAASGTIVMYLYGAAGVGVSTWFDSVRLGEADEHGVFDGDTPDASTSAAHLDAALIEQAATLGDYFDGSTPNVIGPSGYGTTYTWTGTAHASTSTMVEGRVGLLAVSWDPSWGANMLFVDPGMWPTQDVQWIRIERTSSSEGTVPVRGIENLPAPGGGYVGTDHETPINETVQYTVYGYDAAGQLVDSSTAVVRPSAGSCTLYVKAPGRPDMTQQPAFRAVGDASSASRGGVYQIAGGGAVAQDGGADTTNVQVTVRTQSAGESRALEALLAAARTILIQHGGDPEIRPGWWYVVSWRRTNPGQLTYDKFGKRDYELDLIATQRPAGVGVQFTGTTWGALIASQATWQDVMDAYPTWLDVILGEG